MPDIYISHSARDSAIAQQLSSMIEARGLSTWRDLKLMAGAEVSKAIYETITEARAVLVIWTESSIKSDWVLAEASYAARLGKFKPIIVGSLDISHLPMPFNIYATPSFAQIDEAASEKIFLYLLPLTEAVDQTSSEKQKDTLTKKGEDEKPWVFISHVDEDKPRIRQYVEKLLENSLTVFVDKPAKLGLPKKWVGASNLKYIRFFDNYRTSISKALDRSGCVLVFWSKQSVQTERQIFWDEIEFGSINGFLVSTMIDDVVS